MQKELVVSVKSVKLFGEFKVCLHSAKLTNVLALSLAMFLVDKY